MTKSQCLSFVTGILLCMSLTITPTNGIFSHAHGRLLNWFSWNTGSNDHSLSLIENLKTDIQNAQLLIQSIEKSSLSRVRLNQIRSLMSKPLTVCPLSRGAVKVDDSCYEYFVGKETFPIARQSCRAFGGDLASIDLKTSFLSNIRRFYPTLAVDGTHHETWLGATRIRGTNNFKFFNGKSIHSTNARWNQGPSDHNCLILDDVDLVQDMMIDDCDCFNRRSYLCQFNPVKLF